MALALAGRIAGDATAQAIQLGIEYDPQPPTTRAPRIAPQPRSSAASKPSAASSSPDAPPNPPEHRPTAQLLHCSTAPLLHCSTAPLLHCSRRIRLVRSIGATLWAFRNKVCLRRVRGPRCGLVAPRGSGQPAAMRFAPFAASCPRGYRVDGAIVLVLCGTTAHRPASGGRDPVRKTADLAYNGRNSPARRELKLFRDVYLGYPILRKGPILHASGAGVTRRAEGAAARTSGRGGPAPTPKAPIPTAPRTRPRDGRSRSGRSPGHRRTQARPGSSRPAGRPTRRPRRRPCRPPASRSGNQPR
jgi:hypothetical protein